MEKVNELELEDDAVPRNDNFIAFLLRRVLPNMPATVLRSKWGQVSGLFRNLTQGDVNLFVKAAVEKSFSGRSAEALTSMPPVVAITGTTTKTRHCYK